MSDYYKTFGLSSDKSKKNQELYNLYKMPQKNKGVNVPHFYNGVNNNIHQADLLFLPNDKGYKYALTVVDVASKKVDAEPIKNKESATVKTAFEKIYKRKILEIPQRLEVDGGTEFKGVVSTYFKKHGTGIRVGEPDRHHSQGLVERQNLTIGKALFMRQVGQELLTGEPNSDWKDDLPTVITEMNKIVVKRPKAKLSEFPVCKGSNCNLIEEGTKVRKMLYAPRSAHNLDDKLSGKFRATDIRWDPKIRTVISVLIKNGYPPMYLIDGPFKSPMYPEGVDKTAYAKSELQIIPKNEQAPPISVVRGNPTNWIIKEILSDRMVKNKREFQVLWKAGDISFKSEEDLQRDVPEMLSMYLEQKKATIMKRKQDEMKKLAK